MRSILISRFILNLRDTNPRDGSEYPPSGRSPISTPQFTVGNSGASFTDSQYQSTSDAFTSQEEGLPLSIVHTSNDPSPEHLLEPGDSSVESQPHVHFNEYGENITIPQGLHG